MVVLATLLVGSAGCQPERRSGLDRDQVLRTIEAAGSFVSPPAGPDAGEPPIVDFFVDVSPSMRGFVADPRTRYVRVVDELAETLTDRRYRTRLHSFDGAVTAQSGWTFYEATLPNSYHQGRRDSSSVRVVLSSCLTDSSVALILSDLVISEERSPYNLMAEAVTQLGLSRRAVGLMAFRSGFQGDFYIGGGRQRTDHAAVLSEIGREEGRPFYLLVVAANEALLARVLADLRHALNPEEMYSTAMRAAEVDAIVPWPDLRRSGCAVAKLDKRAEPIQTTQGSVWYLVYNPTAAATGRVCTGVDITLRSGASAAALVPARWQSATQSLGIGSMVLLPTGNQVEAQLAPVGERVLRLTISSTGPAAGTCWVHRCEVRPPPSVVAKPDWIEEWSTEDDVSRSHVNRTMGLRSFATFLVTRVAAEVPYLELLIVQP